jgi:hypothetical protein
VRISHQRTHRATRHQELPGSAAQTPSRGKVPLYRGLGALPFPIRAANAKTQAYFDQGLRLAFGFNHAAAQRAFQAAQKLDPLCAMCYWGEALVLGPNINAPMMPEALAPTMAERRLGAARQALGLLCRRLVGLFSEDGRARRVGQGGEREIGPCIHHSSATFRLPKSEG